MDSGTGDLRTSEKFLDFVCSMFGLGEDDSVFDRWVFEKMEEKILFLLFLHGIERLIDRIDGR